MRIVVVRQVGAPVGQPLARGVDVEATLIGLGRRQVDLDVRPSEPDQALEALPEAVAQGAPADAPAH
eukprot:14465942-Alexandrium_andersonii.AAC.1